MRLLAQHGSKEGGKIIAGLEQCIINGAIMSPRDLTVSSLKNRIENLKEAQKDSLILFDPQCYASLMAKQPGARMGNLISEYSNYFKELQIRDIRREKQINTIVQDVYDFQKTISGLSGFIMPNILIEDGLRSESANIAKLFLELSDEFSIENGVVQKTWLTLALGNSCFRNTKHLEDMANEITGMVLQSKGVYLLCETSPGNGENPWYEQHMLAGIMYLNYVLSSAGYEVMNGYSFDNSPFLAAAGGSCFGSGWYNTSRYFSLDRFRPNQGMSRRPNRKYFSRALWTRMDFATVRPFWDHYPWLLNKLDTDNLFLADDPTEEDECLQHWETIKEFLIKIEDLKDTKEKIAFLKQELIKAQQYRSKLITLPIVNFEEQVRELHAALTRFEELAEF